MTDRLLHGCLEGSVGAVVDAGLELLPDFGLAAIPLLDGQERPGEWPAVKRRLRAEGIRVVEHRGVLLLTPGELDQFGSVGLFMGNDELLLVTEWNEEFESFPGRLNTESHNFSETSPLGLEEWMMDAGCVLALGDGHGLNFATLDADLGARLRARFKPLGAKR
jgi:hypothetical protein